MKSRFWRFILKVFGWKFIGDTRPEMYRSVIIEAPHTSVWDFVIGRIGIWILGLNGRFLIKKEIFKLPFLGWIIKRMGGIPVDRGNRGNNIVGQVADYFQKYPNFTIIITPEGTRKYTRHWKRGFYEIAVRANVPIILCYINYGNKTCGVGATFYPTGTYEKDILEIQNSYKHVEARYPENFNMSEMYWNKNEAVCDK